MAVAVSWLDHGLWRQRRRLSAVLDASVHVRSGLRHPGPDVTAWIGWGCRPSGRRAKRLAARHGLSCLLLEEGFMRVGWDRPSGSELLSWVVDSRGLHYDASQPSDLEHLLETGDFSAEELDGACRLLAHLREGMPVMDGAGTSGDDDLGADDGELVLVVDEDPGDPAVRLGGADRDTFHDMLRAALEENPHARILAKTHPDVLAGRREGCLPRLAHPRLTWIADHRHPHHLLVRVSKVYVATSLLGLEALLREREVHCFGLPFYAGWGLTRDRRRCARRTRRRSLAELVAAAYLRYARYVDPASGHRIDALAAARLVAVRRRAVRFWADLPGEPWSGRVYAFGFRAWKREQARSFFGEGVKVRYLRSAHQARRQGISPADRIAVWGLRDPPGLRELAEELGQRVVRVEDGFLRSVGLGADFVPPLSLVFDSRGIYFDPAAESDLEHLLQNAEFPPALRRQAARLREFIVRQGLTKYNLGGRRSPLRLPPAAAGRPVVLVPGQVETDASIVRGCGAVRTNLALLEAARRNEPEAFIVYKPHPDVMAGNRRGRVHLRRALDICDHVETTADIIACVEAADVMHTMTSLSGFDALLRGRRVVCYGIPFYAGWGLTEDRIAIPRRTRRLELDELVAGALLLYPRYRLPHVKGLLTADDLAAHLAARCDISPVRRSGLAALPVKVSRWCYWTARALIPFGG